MNPENTPATPATENPVSTDVVNSEATKPDSLWTRLKSGNFRGVDISDKTAATMLKNTQTSIADIHESTVNASAEMAARNAEAIASIAIAHEAHASESIAAIERLTQSTQQNNGQVNTTSHKSVLQSVAIVIGVVGGVLGIINSAKK